MIEFRLTDTSLHMTGHARSAPYGEDLVCAAASAIFNTAVINVLKLSEDECCAVAYDTAPGDSWVSVTPVRGREEEVRQVFRVIGNGLAGMVATYPAYIRRKEEAAV